MKKSIFLKMFVGFGLIILAASALIMVLSFSTIRSHFQDTLAQELEYLGRALSGDVKGFLGQGRSAELDAFLKKGAKDIHARATVIAPDGTVLADSEKDPTQMENHRYRPEVTEALEGRIGKSLRYSVTVEEKMLYMGLPLETNGRLLGILRLSLFMRDIDVLLGSLRTTIGRSILIMAFAGLLLALWLSLNFTRPIRKLTHAAREVEAGKFETRVTLRSKDDFKELGETFNLMTDKIERLFAETSRQKESLANIIGSIDEGLLVLDAESRIGMANTSFRKIIGENAPEGKFYWEVIRKPKIQEFISRVIAERKLLREEIRSDEKFLLCTGSPLNERGGAVLTFHDISDLRNTEIMKKDFIVNASHELRTPLAAIVGAVETLEESCGELNASSLEILKRHADRLRAIVEDLLKLSELEEKTYKLDVKDTDPRQAARTILQIFAPRMKEKGLEARIDAPEGLPMLKADPFQIEQMLINLVDNAVKYTEKGKIVVGLRAEGKEYVIEVRDDGPGISAEHLPRIFERFYVGDKSRSRKVGGTGLGLSIVKHIVQLHGGSVSVASEVGRGTTFTVRIPMYSS